MAMKVLKLGIECDYKHFLYYINWLGDVCRKPKSGGADEILALKAVNRDSSYLYFIDKDGDVSRSERPRHKPR